MISCLNILFLKLKQNNVLKVYIVSYLYIYIHLLNGILGKNVTTLFMDEYVNEYNFIKLILLFIEKNNSLVL